ncbi:hypothetical protein, variant [Exophiala mesophila]|uniref:Uncharacterized protein n=1 Tax=Exophiala mesophila TaxID=212818 RepID=A0A0D1Z2R6_EXOME|nr:hypothetical protein, variant [Exophiala mesophila]KIV89037.1 hypothetical protein, variant [Exophiala mesophila]
MRTETDSARLDGSHHPVNPHLRRLSSSHAPYEHYCSSCHMRRPSQELLSITTDTVDDFCPDIAMPKCQRPAMHHTRRHSGLCPENLVAQEFSDGTHSPTQMTVKPRACRHNSSGYHHDCHCESVKPVDNLSARYGIDDHSGPIKVRRQSTEQEAMDQVSEIMHEEMLADMEARQSRL